MFAAASGAYTPHNIQRLPENAKEPAVLADSLKFGGGKRDRTADLLHAMQALYQLSYTPNLVANQGLEPRTQGL